ncbi:MAG: efflux RND transporter permease subunit [Candidatus Omnitrophica bacterium]|nr:efflux RND transporter permease subunit [Candidatus Omnitrophota bacterium]
MKDRIISFFLKRHLLANLIFVTVFIGGIVSWHQMRKEELPDVTFDTVRISVQYPGASSEEVEYYVTKPIEEAVRSIDGVHRVTSSTGIGSSRVTAEIEQGYSNKDEVMTEIRNEVLDVDLPEDIIDDPEVRIFKTSRKAIIDVGLFCRPKRILDVDSRKALQTYALALENQLLSLQEVNSINRTGYLKDEIQIKIYPQKLIDYNIPFNTVTKEITNNNVRQPAGSIENVREPKVTLSGELTSIEELKALSIQGGFEGQVVRLSDIAEVVPGYEKTTTVTKINGHEGIFLNVVKSSRYGILDALDAVQETVHNFEKNSLAGTDIQVVLLDDESVDVRNRLNLIGINGLIGFILVLVALFLFLDFQSGIWTAMGIPFTFCFTLIVALCCNYSINNITLAAVIIVMGMVVDDAIVVAENVTRLRARGLSQEEAAAQGTSFVLLPIIASIVTTCIAFVPLFFFSGRFGVMVKYIPPIVSIMLGASLLEAICILPGHMSLPFGRKVRCVLTCGLWPLVERRIERHRQKEDAPEGHWFARCENAYGKIIYRALGCKRIVFIFFIVLLITSGVIAKEKMKFIMFPDEETRDIRLTAEAPPGTKRYETARLSQPLEDIIMRYIGKEVVGFRNEIGRGRGGSSALENNLRMHIEILPKEKRKKSADQLIAEWEKQAEGIEGITKVRFSKTWHGQSGGSPIEITVKENNNETRRAIAAEIAAALASHPALINAEIDQPPYNPEYQLELNRDIIRRLAINPSDIAKTLRAALEGSILYDFSGDDEPVYVRLTVVEDAKDDIDKIFEIPVENQGKYLVPLNDLVTVHEVLAPDSIERDDMKRTTRVYADLKPGARTTPLDIARYFEGKLFREFQSRYPSSIIEFTGEVQDTRESQRDFVTAIIMTIALIFVVLALLFNSLLKPFIIMLAIPFGVVGIILAFWGHGIAFYGFFAVIGALGLSGVVINDAIIMIAKLDSEFDPSQGIEGIRAQVAQIAQTRLRAVILTTVTTVVAIIPTAYGWAGYDAMLAQMMLALAWGLSFGTLITLLLIPCIYDVFKRLQLRFSLKGAHE